MNIEIRKKKFCEDLKKLNVPEMVQKYLTYGDCYALNQDDYFNLKSKIAKNFAIHHSEVLIVGSGKLGFSIVETKRYRDFCDTSDIDVAIVSPSLFDSIWLDVFNYNSSGGYWEKINQFKDYLFKGWIRPDKLPPSKTFERSSEWWEFFREITNSQDFGDFKISAGLYKSWYFLESYQSKCISECKLEVKSDENYGIK